MFYAQENTMKGQAKHLQIHKVQIQKLLSIAGVLELSQIARMVDIKQENLETIITQMQKAGRLFRSGSKIAADDKALANYSPPTIRSMWVFADFIHRTDYYTAGEFPAVVCFFADGVEYEIIPVEQGQENIVNRAVSKTEDPPLRLIVIDDKEQIGKLKIPGIAAYCLVDEDGTVQYFKEK